MVNPQLLRNLGSLSRKYDIRRSAALNTSALINPNSLHEHEASNPKGSTHPGDVLADPGFKIRDLFEAGVHWGHKIGSLDPRMSHYLFGVRLGHCIFDLDTTAEHLRLALQFTFSIAAAGGIILFASGRDSRNAHAVEKAALAAGECAHVRAWRGGVFTNSAFQFGATVRLPDLVIMTNVKPSSPLASQLDQHYLVRDSAKMGVPTIGIVDSDCNPNLITYPVPGDDDSPRAISLYLKLFVRCILIGKEQAKNHQDNS